MTQQAQVATPIVANNNVANSSTTCTSVTAMPFTGDELPMALYRELHLIAINYLRKERRGHTLQADDLVNEAFLRVRGSARLKLRDEQHFLAVTSQTMRRVLVDYARRQNAGKRIGAHQKISIDCVSEPTVQPQSDALGVREAIEHLHAENPRQAQLVMLRFFEGLSTTEAADALGVSPSTYARDWNAASDFLREHLAA